MVPIQSITHKNFKKYGSVIEFPKDSPETFMIVETEEYEPWRIAIFRYNNKSTNTLECHPSSKESFEPLKGITILILAGHETPENYEAFVLDKPVCLHKGVWHQVLALTVEAQVKITENLEVESMFYKLQKEISAQIG